MFSVIEAAPNANNPAQHGYTRLNEREERDGLLLADHVSMPAGRHNLSIMQADVAIGKPRSLYMRRDDYFTTFCVAAISFAPRPFG